MELIDSLPCLNQFESCHYYMNKGAKMWVKKLIFLVFLLSFQVLRTESFSSLPGDLFFLVIHSEEGTGSWVTNVKNRLKSQGLRSSGDLMSANWLLQPRPDLNSFATLLVGSKETEESSVKKVGKAVALVRRKFASPNLRLVLVSDALTHGIAQKFLSANSVGSSGVAPSLVTYAGISQFLKSTKIPVDDWAYDRAKNESYISNPRPNKSLRAKSPSASYPSQKFKGRRSTSAPMVSGLANMAMMEADRIGLSVGGAKDIGNFRENIKEGFLPRPTDLTYEGLFYDYSFDPGESGDCVQIFCPSYTKAVAPDPFSMNEEYYLAVGLESGLKASEFHRKNLNLVVVLDISGSMGSPFDQYHYDAQGQPRLLKEEDRDRLEEQSRTKLEIANQAIVDLMGHLKPQDSFALVLFDDDAYLAKPLRPVGATNMEAIKKHVLSLAPRGGTNLSKGMEMGASLLQDLESGTRDYENRIIFLTDAMPNSGQTRSSDLLEMVRTNAARYIHSTLVGVGVDFQTELVEEITRVRGANYYSVHSSRQFRRRLAEEFDFMVTPLVFDLSLSFASSGFAIEKVYGAPGVDGSNGELLKIHTLFPSKQEDGENKGGLILLKLKPLSGERKIELRVSYEDTQGKLGGKAVQIRFPNKSISYENSGIRKGVLLAKYADLMRHWILDERSRQKNKLSYSPGLRREIGIHCPRPLQDYGLGEWEQNSMELKVSKFYRGLFQDFSRFFEQEMQILQDWELKQELKILRRLGLHSG
jgi:Ca-activated chloride channel homolog